MLICGIYCGNNMGRKGGGQMTEKGTIYDAAVVGSGPAGLTAAIYLARSGIHTVVLEKDGIGGQVTSTWEVANYPGVAVCSGYELADTMQRQAKDFGSEFRFAKVTALRREAECWCLTAGREQVYARAVVLAMGAVPRKAGFEGEEEYSGRGVSYCAACDGAFFRGKEIFVVGGGVAAVEEGIFLTRFAEKVTLVVRRDVFSCPPSVSGRVQEQEKLAVRFCTKIKAVAGKDTVKEITFYDSKTEREWTERNENGYGVFVLAGRIPDTAWLPDALARDEAGYLLTDTNLKTALPGVYAAGDVCAKKLRQIATAVSDGAVAAAELEKYLHVQN